MVTESASHPAGKCKDNPKSSPCLTSQSSCTIRLMRSAPSCHQPSCRTRRSTVPDSSDAPGRRGGAPGPAWPIPPPRSTSRRIGTFFSDSTGPLSVRRKSPGCQATTRSSGCSHSSSVSPRGTARASRTAGLVQAMVPLFADPTAPRGARQRTSITPSRNGRSSRISTSLPRTSQRSRKGATTSMGRSMESHSQMNSRTSWCSASTWKLTSDSSPSGESFWRVFWRASRTGSACPPRRMSSCKWSLPPQATFHKDEPGASAG